MTTCEDMTFERLLAHVTHNAHGDQGDGPTSDLPLVRHVAFCDRCSARVLALRAQSLALAALARAHHARDGDTASAEAHRGGLRDELHEPTGSHQEPGSGAASSRTADGGPGACLGAVRDAGLASYHRALRELFMACLWADPQRARRLDGSTPTRPVPPLSVGEIALDLTSLAKRLAGLGLAISAEGLPNATPAPSQVAETAGPILDRITALEGSSPWVARARNALRDD